MSGQRGHRDPPDVSRPNHHLRATWHSAGSRCKSRPVEGIAESKNLHEGQKPKGFEPYLLGRRKIAEIGKHDYPQSSLQRGAG